MGLNLRYSPLEWKHSTKTLDLAACTTGITFSGAMTTGATMSGTMTTGLQFSNSCTNYVDFNNVGTAGTSIALHFKDAFAAKVIETGSYSSAVDKGVTLSGTNNRPVSFLFDDSDTALTGDVRAVLSRVYLGANITAASTVDAIRGQVKMPASTNQSGDYIAGLRGYIEFAGAATMNLNADHHAVSGLHSRIELGGNLTLTKGILAGVYAELNTTGAYSINAPAKSAAFVAIATDQANDNWGAGLYIDGADVMCHFGSASDFEDGIKTSAATPTGNTSHAIKIRVGASTYGYIPVYDDVAFNSGD